MAVYISGLKKPRAVEPSGSKETMRHRIFRLICDKAVDNWITLNTSSGLDNPMLLDIYVISPLHKPPL